MVDFIVLKDVQGTGTRPYDICSILIKCKKIHHNQTRTVRTADTHNYYFLSEITLW